MSNDKNDPVKAALARAAEKKGVVSGRTTSSQANPPVAGDISKAQDEELKFDEKLSDAPASDTSKADSNVIATDDKPAEHPDPNINGEKAANDNALLQEQVLIAPEKGATPNVVVSSGPDGSDNAVVDNRDNFVGPNGGPYVERRENITGVGRTNASGEVLTDTVKLQKPVTVSSSVLDAPHCPQIDGKGGYSGSGWTKKEHVDAEQVKAEQARVEQAQKDAEA